MADVKKVVEIEIDLETGDIKQLNREVDKLDKGVKKAAKGTNGMAVGFKRVGTALKAAGIGLVVAALAKLVQLFSENQKIADGFATSMNALSIAFNDFFKFIENNVGTVTKYFKELFSNPAEKIKEIGENIKNYLIAQIKTAVEGLGLLADSIGFLLDGEFAKAAKTAGEGALKLGEAFIKINPSTAIMANLAETIYDNRDAIAEYTSNTWKAAEAITQTAAASQFLEVESRRLQLAYQKQAEELRQIRDDESKSIEERIDANRRLGELLVESAEAEKGNIQKRINGLEQEQKLLGYNRDRQIEIENLKVEQLDIDERIAGFRSEQLTNENALLREQGDIYNQIDELRIKRTTEGMEQEIALSAMKYDQLYAQAKGNAELEEELKLAYLAEIEAIEQKYRDKKKEEDEKAAKEEAEARMRLQEQVFTAAAASITALSDLGLINAKQSFQMTKALNIAEATINGVQAVQKTLAQGGFLAVPLAIAMGITAAANVASIAAQRFEPTGRGGGGANSIRGASGAGGVRSPQFNTVGGSEVNQLSQSIAGQNQKPVQAYVVANDVTSAQSLERNRQQQASFP